MKLKLRNIEHSPEKTSLLRALQMLTYVSIAPFLCGIGKTVSADQDQMPQTAASDRGLHSVFAYRMLY